MVLYADLNMTQSNLVAQQAFKKSVECKYKTQCITHENSHNILITINEKDSRITMPQEPFWLFRTPLFHCLKHLL